MASDSPRLWAKWLSLAEFWYNTTFLTSLKTTPFQALYGYSPPILSLDTHFDTPSEDANRVMEERQSFLRQLRENLVQASSRMKFFADKHRIEREFDVGDFVYVKLQPYRQNSVSLRRSVKLAARYYGPYKILERIGKVAYRLDLPESARIHPVFHVSLLKKSLGKDVIPVSALPPTDSAGIFKIEPCSILDHRQISRRGVDTQQVLLQWSATDPTLLSWEDVGFVRKKFHSLDPWGQGSSRGGGIVMSPGGEGEAKGSVSVDDGEELVLNSELQILGLNVEKKAQKGGIDPDRPRGIKCGRLVAKKKSCV